MKKAKLIRMFTTILQQELEPFKTNLNAQVPKDKTLSRREVMQLLKISSTTMWKRCKEGTLPTKKIGRKYIFLESEIMQFLKENNQ